MAQDDQSTGGGVIQSFGVGQDDPGVGQRLRRPRKAGRAAEADDGQGAPRQRDGLLRDEMV